MTYTPRRVERIPSTRCSPSTIEYIDTYADLVLGDGNVVARCTACSTYWTAYPRAQGGVGQTVHVRNGGCR